MPGRMASGAARGSATILRMLLDADDCQLVLIDYQARLMPAIAEAPVVTANALRLAQAAQAFQVPIWCTEQSPEKLGPTVDALAAVLKEVRATPLAKTAFSACVEGLAEALRPPAPAPARPSPNARSLPKHLRKPPEPAQAPADERASIVIAGVEAHVCLLQTALDLLEQEFEVWVVTDACGSRSERNRDAAYDRLSTSGAELVTTEMVIFEWLRDARHPLFARMQGLVK